MATRISPERERRFWEGVTYVSDFLMGTSPVHDALLRLVRTLDELEIPYAIVGAMALGEYGYVRATADVDVLLTREGLEKLKRARLGRGYVEKFPGSKGLRDTESGVAIDVLIAGDYPGDGKPKPVCFPDPAAAAAKGARVSLLPIERLVELKLASGMTSVHRAKDIGDVVELIKHAALPRELGDRLDPSVRPKFLELWDALQEPEPLE